jgi:hypothetical protein
LSIRAGLVLWVFFPKFKNGFEVTIWGSKVTKAGDAFAAGKNSNFGPRKAGLKTIFRLREENLDVKVGPSLLYNFPLGPKGV